MTRTFDDVMNNIPQARAKKIRARGEAMLNEYLTLSELRKARKLTQEALAKKLNVNQENISRLEKRSDMMISTLRNTVEAMGGELEITVRFENGKPVSLGNFDQV